MNTSAPPGERATTPDLFSWLENRPDSDFPKDGGLPYQQRAKQTFELLAPFYAEVLAKSVRPDSGYLTAHGADHIRTVLARAQDLVTGAFGNLVLQPYELHLMVMAVLFHDLGNAAGREGHERKHAEIMGRLGLIAGTESVERRTIRQIAAAHGGSRLNNKDTLSTLDRRTTILHQQIRPRVIAAIVRFADELADDFSRASAFLNFETTGMGVPQESEVYHQYAKSLHSVTIDRRDRYVLLRFAFHESLARALLGKGAGKVYLFDEIHERTLKVHRERIYCARFWEAQVPLEAIRVEIEVDQDDSSLDPLIKTTYTLSESGYPTDPSSIAECATIAPDITSGLELISRIDAAKALASYEGPTKEK